MKIPIDRSKWRCGGSGKNAHGRGMVRLQNHEGFMCCMGMAAKAADPDAEILDVGLPADVEEHNEAFRELLLKPGKVREITDSDFVNDCVGINDSAAMTAEMREANLQATAEEYGHEFEFFGEYGPFGDRRWEGGAA